MVVTAAVERLFVGRPNDVRPFEKGVSRPIRLSML